jgi:hypothetical protein
MGRLGLGIEAPDVLGRGCGLAKGHRRGSWSGRSVHLNSFDFGFAVLGYDLAVSDRVEVLDAGFFGRVVRIAGGLPGLQALKAGCAGPRG